jgi:prevent-host-death family protein
MYLNRVYNLDSLDVIALSQRGSIMNNQWQLQEAKNKFSSLVDKALENGPQIVTRRGKEAVVVISVDEYRDLIKPELDIIEFFQTSPLIGYELDTTRNKDYPRDVEL